LPVIIIIIIIIIIITTTTTTTAQVGPRPPHVEVYRSHTIQHTHTIGGTPLKE
jgi:hypothetical protein